ncbi:hypothetical protein C1645_779726 [Glomus cerebriforme]|uniref:GATA-type domain-containing protein n=1 Tax=Glomus cerebriforme TaxID=658196 RepID=A0A397SLA4_9GLOM|nr:hypothetical protein C1645_779726 [Glomus cerebriforme]
MDVMSMCSSSSPTSNQTAPRKIPEFASTQSHAQSLPSPPLMDTVNEKKGSSLPPLTSITSILHSPVPPLHEINPTPVPPKPQKLHHDAATISNQANHNIHHQSSTPQSPPSRVNYLQPPESISQRSSPSSSSYSSSSQSISQSPNDTTWLRPPTTSYYQSFPPPPPPPQQYPYVPQSQQQSMRLVNNYSHPSATTNMTSDYPPPYATSISYTSTGNHIGSEDHDSSYLTEQSLVKMGKVTEHCSQIAHFASQYRDMRINYNPWNGSAVPQFTESHLTSIINRAYDVLNILSSLKGEITAKPQVETSQGEIDLIRKQRTLGASTRTKYRKRSKRAAPPGRCHSCNISETPEWRRGPDGARTLCNACGLHFAKITRKRALSAMQQAEQQQQQQQQQQEEEVTSSSSNINLTNSPIIDNNSNNNSSMPTPGASDVERDSPHVKRQMIEIIDD